MNKRTYVSFIPQEDNVLDVIQAEDINELQEAIKDNQEEIFRQADTQFLDRCLFTLSQTPQANAMIYDLLQDTNKINVPEMKGIRYNEKIRALVLDNAFSGSFITKALINETGRPYRKLYLITDHYQPQGTDMIFEFSYDGISYYPMTPNHPAVTILPNERGECYIRVTMTRGLTSVVPRLDAWALIYEDETYVFRYMEDGLDIDIEASWDGRIIE